MSERTMLRRITTSLAATAVALTGLFVTNTPAALAGTVTDIVTIAAENEGKTACGTNSRGGQGYYTSCTGDGGSPEAWCADFAKWVWNQAGADVRGLTSGVGSFALYGTMKNTPAVGDAVVFNYNGNGWGEHVVIVAAVHPNGNITTIGGNQGGSGPGNSTVSYYRNISSAIGSTATGQRLDGYVSPRGLTATAGHVYDNIRFDNGSWQGAVAADRAQITETAVTGEAAGDMHLFTLSGGHVYHNIRRADTTWQGAKLADGGAVVSHIATTATGRDVHLFTLSAGKVFHNIRSANGSWTGANLLDGNGTISGIATTTTPNGEIHLFTLGGGKVYHNVRSWGGSWSGAHVVDGNGQIGDIAASAAPNGEVHLFTLAQGRVYHNLRYVTTRWQGANVADGSGRVQRIATGATPNGEVHLITLGSGLGFHNLRRPDGSWQGANVFDANGRIIHVAATGMPNGDLHIETIA